MRGSPDRANATGSQASGTVRLDRLMNEVAREGCDRCACGCKYWENDHCVDCGTIVPMLATLTALDRCDRCGAQAYMRVTLPSDTELLFCGHHAREHGDKLREVALHILDETEKPAHD